MKIFLTGITGLLGRHIAQTCVQRGHDVLALVRDKKTGPSQFAHKVGLCYGDLSDTELLKQKISETEVVIHCAANTSMLARKNSRTESANIRGLQNILHASKHADIKKLIFISSANTLQAGDAKAPGDESQRLMTHTSRLAYINSKIQGEEILLKEYKNSGFPVIILNPGFILGPEDHKISSGKLILSVLKGQLLFYPPGGKSIVDARDVALTAINAISRGRIGQNYLLCNENLSYREIFSLVSRQAGVKVPKYELSSIQGKITGVTGSLLELISGRSFSINHKTLKLAFEDHYYKIEKAKAELGFDPRPAAETIHDTVKWFQNEYLLHKRSRK